jgi:hypothetical protein
MSEKNLYRSRYLSLRSIGLVVVLFAFIGLLLWQLRARGASPLDPAATPRAVTPRGELSSDEKTTIALFRQASPSVVHLDIQSFFP